MGECVSNDFMHITRGRGNSWKNPIKYLKDTINLEKQVVEQFHGQFPGVSKQSLEQMEYYLYYIGMSYFYHNSHIDNVNETSVFVFGRDGAIEHNRRGVNHWTMYLKHFPNKYLSYYFRGNLYYRLNEFELSCQDYIKCFELNSKRNESLIEAVDIYNRNLKKPELAFELLIKTIDNECVIKYNDTDFVQTDLYIDTGIRYFEYWYETAINCRDEKVTKFVIDVMNRGLSYKGYHFVDMKLRESMIRNYIDELKKLC
jgi:tetratricopeptide (TPR) repeat protein